MKKEIRILGIDDGPFKFTQNKALLVGTILRGNLFIECVMSRKIEIDGFDVTEKVIDMILNRKRQIKVIITDGITFAGFNILDMEKVYSDTGIGIIAVSRKEPDFRKMENVMKNLPDFDRRIKILRKMNNPKEISFKDGKIYFQSYGFDDSEVVELLEIARGRSLIPEAVRISHLIASGIVKGESKGRV